MTEVYRLQFTVDEDEEGQRLDRWLADCLLELQVDASRTQLQEWIKRGLIARVDSTKAVKSSDLVVAASTYIVQIPELQPVELAGDEVAFDIVYEDDSLVVVNKPRGLVVHPAAGHARGTLVNGLVHRGTLLCPLGGEMRPGVVHRIDKDTSGLLVLAKTEMAYRGLTEQLRTHAMEREYTAIVHGTLEHSLGTVDAPVGRDPKNRQRMAVVAGGKHAVTHFRVDRQYARYARLTCQLETGRTHQIRVHMAYIDHPLAGDPLYGPRHTLPIIGQALHAGVLGFVHPQTGAHLKFEAPLPTDMEQLVEWLERDG
ncbi:MAG: RluA family pseudouridine synthase [Alicyclobacillaceae bacterium]|nr:RluA family pseudouridine synthase [Alicyclobacillaceae bacterium]